jgi:hypothetical protein
MKRRPKILRPQAKHSSSRGKQKTLLTYQHVTRFSLSSLAEHRPSWAFTALSTQTSEKCLAESRWLFGAERLNTAPIHSTSGVIGKHVSASAPEKSQSKMDLERGLGIFPFRSKAEAGRAGVNAAIDYET